MQREILAPRVDLQLALDNLCIFHMQTNKGKRSQKDNKLYINHKRLLNDPDNEIVIFL